MSPRVIGYTWGAAVHCAECTRNARIVCMLAPSALDIFALASPALDANGVALNLTDWEGNAVHPIFSTDENAHAEACDDCGAELAP